MEEYPIKCRKVRLKMYGHVILLSERIIITACGQKSRSDGCAEEAKERKTEAEVDGQHQG